MIRTISLHERRRRGWLLAGAILTIMLAAVAGSALGPTNDARAAGPAIVVKPSAMNGWYFWNDKNDTFAGSPGELVSGPGTPPLGTGSVRLGPLTDNGATAAGHSVIATDAYFGTPLADITALSYSTYQPGPILAVAAQFDVRYRTTDTAYGGRLVFEPYQNGAVTVGSGWQAWTPLSGKWWATKTTLAGTGGTRVVALPSGNCAQATPCTWSEINAAFPAAKVYGRFLLKAGSNWLGFDGNADNLTIGVSGVDTTYDFEPETACTTTCYVNVATGNDAFGGDTPTSAKKTIQAGINQVAPTGTVIVAAGIYGENVIINRDDITIVGAGIGATVLQGTACGGTGIALTGNRSNVAIKLLTVTGYQYGVTTDNIGSTVSNILVEDVSASSNCVHGLWFQAGVTNDLTLRRVNASSNGGGGGRGFWIINGVKTNITIEDGTFNNNALVGIDISDGNVTGLSITGNTVAGNGDSGIGVLGAQGPGANLIDGNIVTNNGRFGIEIKIPSGTGAASGPGSVVVSNNQVSRTIAATDARDYAGIAIFRRSVDLLLNAPQPSGVVVTGNDVNGFTRKLVGSTGDGFGILVEGTNNTIDHNTVTGSDVGIQAQAGNIANVQSTPYFDRGDGASFGGVINRNGIAGNAVGLRLVGVAGPVDATCNWWGGPSGPNTLGADTAIGGATTSPWLITSNLNGICNGGTARGLKQVVLAQLQALAPINKDTDKRIAEAIKHLQKSLDNSAWVDDNHLNGKKGEKVFDEERETVKKLGEIKNPSAGLAASIAGWIDSLVAADRTLATTAIAEGGSAKDLAKANDEVAEGDTDRNNGKFTKAIDHYKHAWEALKKEEDD